MIILSENIPITIKKIRSVNKRRIVGWLAVSSSIVITCFWAFWGIIENFHEGWYYPSLPSNLALMFAQYLSPMLIFIGVTLLSVAWPRFGAAVHIGLSLLAVWFFQTSSIAATLLIITPLLGLGLLYWFGRPEPRLPAAFLVVGLPLMMLIIFGAEPALRVSQRVDDGNLEARPVHGNGVSLTWAPVGPGWPRQGAKWAEAQRICQYLTEDGVALAPTPQNTWRLPTVEEAVRSMVRRGQNSGGMWDAENARASYRVRPDKEAPLWNTHSQVIYWWTATAVNENQAYIIAYDGQVWPRNRQFGPAYLAFRCVKPPVK
jgi:hypothetical protein